MTQTLKKLQWHNNFCFFAVPILLSVTTVSSSVNGKPSFAKGIHFEKVNFFNNRTSSKSNGSLSALFFKDGVSTRYQTILKHSGRGTLKTTIRIPKGTKSVIIKTGKGESLIVGGKSGTSTASLFTIKAGKKIFHSEGHKFKNVQPRRHDFSPSTFWENLHNSKVLNITFSVFDSFNDQHGDDINMLGTVPPIKYAFCKEAAYSLTCTQTH